MIRLGSTNGQTLICRNKRTNQKYQYQNLQLHRDLHRRMISNMTPLHLLKKNILFWRILCPNEAKHHNSQNICPVPLSSWKIIHTLRLTCQFAMDLDIIAFGVVWTLVFQIRHSCTLRIVICLQKITAVVQLQLLEITAFIWFWILASLITRIRTFETGDTATFWLPRIRIISVEWI